MPSPVLRILFGPPGTGKTWRAAREAVRLLEPGVSDADIQVRHKALVANGQILWITFHPSYSYEDFVEGFRPEVTEKGIHYSPRPGPFRIACNNVTLASPANQLFFVGQRLASTTDQEYDVVTASLDSVVLRKVKGKGIGLITPVSLHLVERLRELGYKAGELSLSGNDQEQKAKIAKNVGYDAQSLFGTTGPLRVVMEHVESVAAPGPDVRRSVVLVIDEINRGDLSRVFGEMITLLEPDKRIGAPEERRVLLPYSQTLFGVPSELHVLGTMNTADRSIALMDAALRRRFEFVEVPPDASRCASPFAGTNLGELLERWNRTLRTVASKDQQIGHAYFERDRLESLRERLGYASGEEGELRALAETIRRSILPLLLDVLRQDWRLVDFVFGRDLDGAKPALLEEVEVGDLQARAGDYLDLSGATDYRIPAWWDANSAHWNPERFRQVLGKATT